MSRHLITLYGQRDRERAAVQWKSVVCHECDGHGTVSDYGDGEDFYGPKECQVCAGTGRLFISPGGRLAVYPGGPFRGRE